MTLREFFTALRWDWVLLREMIEIQGWRRTLRLAFGKRGAPRG
jgi:hypothetical protein